MCNKKVFNDHEPQFIQSQVSEQVHEMRDNREMTAIGVRLSRFS